MHSMMPFISVITPMYRSADTLPAALNSLLRQDDWRWESIVVDDGSPDNSRDVAQEFANRDSRFRVMSQANAGACAARNTGLAVARGRYMLFLDADDWLEPGALAAMSRACERRQWAAVHGAFRYARPDGTLTQWDGSYTGDLPLFALASSNILALPSCVLLRKSVLDDVGGFDPTLVNCGDWDLWARVARHQGRIGRIDMCVTGYRMRMASLSRNPMNLVRDAATVLNRIHARDPRVRHPQRHLAMGSHPSYLLPRLAGFTFYAGALAALQGRSADSASIMNSLSHWPELSARRVAEFLLHAACFSRCVAPDDSHPIPPEIQEGMDRIVADLQRRTRMPYLKQDVDRVLQQMGFGHDQDEVRMADRARLLRPLAAEETVASAYLRSLALRECVA
jgi:glycosyltransferase involved in cell wall biosynthesis